MAANLSSLEAVTKEVYEPGVAEQLDNDVTTLKRVERSARGITRVGGRYVTFPIHTRRNRGIGARNESEPLPPAGQQGHAAARIGLKYHYGAVELTGQAIALISEDYQAFVDAMDMEIEGLRRDLAKDMNRQVYGSSRGTIATAQETGSLNTVEVDRPDLFEYGDIVDIVDHSALPTVTYLASAREITGIDLANSTVTFDGAAVTFDADDFFVRRGNLNREWTGFEDIIGTTNKLYDIDPSTEPVWKANVDDGGGTPRPVSEGILTTMADTIMSKGGKTTVMFTTLGIRRAYANLLTQQRQFVNTKEFTGGFAGIAFVHDKSEIPIVTDNDAPPGTVLFINEDELRLYREKPWSFMDMDGSKWKQKIDSSGRYDAWEAILHQYSEIGTRRRNTHGKLTNLIEQ